MLRPAVQPEVPSRVALGDADSRKNVGNAGTAGREAADEICVKQEALEDLRLLGFEIVGQLTDGSGEVPRSIGPKAVDWYSRSFYGLDTGRF